jgi:outer membrane protein assembly factor BamB
MAVEVLLAPVSGEGIQGEFIDKVALEAAPDQELRYLAVHGVFALQSIHRHQRHVQHSHGLLDSRLTISRRHGILKTMTVPKFALIHAWLTIVTVVCTSPRLMAGNSDPVRQPHSPATARIIASSEPDWPQWRGPRRDGICDETGLLKQWPEGGPKLLWSTSGIGQGYSAPIVVGDRLYITGDAQDKLVILSFDLSGKLVWRATNGAAWKGPYPGSRANCTYHRDQLFHCNAHGRVVCLDPLTGRERWAVDILDKFGAKNITWAISECLLVADGRVFVTAGGSRALMAALNADNGEVIWQSEPLTLGASKGQTHLRVAKPEGETDSASYASPILADLAGYRQIVGCSLRHAFGVNADTGRLLWTYPLPSRYQVIAATPVLLKEGVFFTAPDAGGGRLLRLQSLGADLTVEQAWTTPLDTCHGGLVTVDGRLYGSYYRDRKGWACVDTQTGAVLYELKDLAMGPVLYADRRLYCLSQEGEMALLEPSQDSFKVQGRFRLVSDRVNDAWTHPVIHRGHLYLRYHDQLYCYSISPPTQ